MDLRTRTETALRISPRISPQCGLLQSAARQVPGNLKAIHGMACETSPSHSHRLRRQSAVRPGRAVRGVAKNRRPAPRLRFPSGRRPRHGLPIRKPWHGQPIHRPWYDLPIHRPWHDLPIHRPRHGQPIRKPRHGLAIHAPRCRPTQRRRGRRGPRRRGSGR